MDFDDDSANASVDVTNLSDLMMIINDATGAFQWNSMVPKVSYNVCVWASSLMIVNKPKVYDPLLSKAPLNGLSMTGGVKS